MTTLRLHPNRVPFEGVLTRLDQPSDKSPRGALGHPVILTSAAAQDALPTLVGMAVNFSETFDDHDVRQKCGVITAAAIVGDELRVQGHLFCHDFPEVAEEMKKPNANMGMSYDMVNARVQDLRAPVWLLISVTFTGAAMLKQSKAAYKSTSFRIAAVGERFTGKLSLLGSVRLVKAKLKT